MRLKDRDIELIRKIVRKYFPNAKIYIFGSMLDDTKRGGDVDIFIITDEKITLSSKSNIRFFLEDRLLRPVDLVFHKDFDREIEKEALKGVEI